MASPVRQVIDLAAELASPDAMPPQQALEFYEEIVEHIESVIEGLKADVARG